MTITYIQRLIKEQEALTYSRDIVLKSIQQCEGDILILDKGHMWAGPVRESDKVINYVVYPRSDGIWACKITNKGALPQNWWGESGEKLSNITGVLSSPFCHKLGFICGAHDKAGAASLAKLASNILKTH